MDPQKIHSTPSLSSQPIQAKQDLWWSSYSGHSAASLTTSCLFAPPSRTTRPCIALVKMIHECSLSCAQHKVEIWLKIVSLAYEGTKTLIVLDDCAASRDVKGRTGQLVNLGFSARHICISVWVLTQKLTGMTASFRENVAAIVLFYSPSAKTTKSIFDDYAGELSMEEYKKLTSKLKEQTFSHLVFLLRHPYGVEFSN